MRYTDVSPNQLIAKVAEKLKSIEHIKPPVWAGFVKTGVHKERQPTQEDWWYVRCAAVLRTVANVGPIGTNKLIVKYGGRKRRGHKKNRFMTGSGSIARKALQQLESAGLIKHSIVSDHKGRIITPTGSSLLDKTAQEVFNGNQ